MESTWSLNGKSGTRYSFTVITKSGHLPQSGGILLPVYAHPRGHRAGFQVNALGVHTANDMEATRASLSKHQELTEQCWNYTLVLEESDPDKQLQIAEDLSK
nr:hypothetical protein [uncultured Desulfobulbus sp.]